MKSNLLLLLTAIIWGFAFVAQRAGMEHIGPFTFNAARFILGSLSLIPLILVNRTRKQQRSIFDFNKRTLVKGGAASGIFLFLGATFQQSGLVHTSAGKGGFITGFYIILVPILALLFKQKTSLFTWFGAFISVVGLYLLSVDEALNINTGDILIFGGAFFWAFQILVIGFYSNKTDPIELAITQFTVCALFSLIAAFITESVILSDIYKASIPILYAGIFSAGIAFTLQIVAQKKAHPSNAAIIMSLEAVFAVIGGWLILDESIDIRGLFGCGLMLTGIILSQIKFSSKTELSKNIF